MRLALLCDPVSLPAVTADAMAHIENSAEDSIIVEIIALDQRMLCFPRLFAIEQVWKTILPTIRPVKRTFIAAVQAKKMGSYGIGATKLKNDIDNVKSSIVIKMEKTDVKNLMSAFGLEEQIRTNRC